MRSSTFYFLICIHFSKHKFNLKMNLYCDFHAFNSKVECTDDYKNCKGLFSLSECDNNTEDHISELHLMTQSSDHQIPTEKQLILMRCGIDPFISHLDDLTICVKHRKILGLWWKSSKKCCNPDHNNRQTPTKRISFDKAFSIIGLVDLQLLNNIFKNYVYGSLICLECYNALESVLKKPILIKINSKLSTLLIHYY